MLFDSRFCGRYEGVHPTTALLGGNEADKLLFTAMFAHYNDGSMADMMVTLLHLSELFGEGDFGNVLNDLKQFVPVFKKRVRQENYKSLSIFPYWLSIVTRSDDNKDLDSSRDGFSENDTEANSRVTFIKLMQ